MSPTEDRSNRTADAMAAEADNRATKVKDAIKAVATRNQYTNMAAENLLNLRKMRVVYINQRDRIQADIQQPLTSNAARQNALIAGIITTRRAPLESAIAQTDIRIKQAETYWDQSKDFQRWLDKGKLEVINPWLKEKTHQLAHLFTVGPPFISEGELKEYQNYIDKIETGLLDVQRELQQHTGELLDPRRLAAFVSGTRKIQQEINEQRDIVESFNVPPVSEHAEAGAVSYEERTLQRNKEKREGHARNLPILVDLLRHLEPLWVNIMAIQSAQLSTMPVSAQQEWQASYSQKLESHIRQKSRLPTEEEIYDEKATELTAHVFEQGYSRIGHDREQHITNSIREEKTSQLRTKLIADFQERGLDVSEPAIDADLNRQINSQFNSWEHSHEYFQIYYRKDAELPDIEEEYKKLDKQAEAHIAQPAIKEKLNAKVEAEVAKNELQVKRSMLECVEAITNAIDDHPSNVNSLHAQLAALQEKASQDVLEAEHRFKEAESALTAILNPSAQDKRKRRLSIFAARQSDDEIRTTLIPLVETGKKLTGKGPSQEPFTMVEPALQAKGLVLTAIDEKYFLLSHNKRNEVTVINPETHTLTNEEHQKIIDELKKPLEERSHFTTVAPKPTAEVHPGTQLKETGPVKKSKAPGSPR